MTPEEKSAVLVNREPDLQTMDKLIIVSDLGRLKCWHLKHDPDDPSLSPSFEDIASETFDNAHTRFADRETDQAGRFSSRATSANPASPGMSTGERHGEIEKAERDELESLAESINELVARNGGLPIYLAAPRTIHRRLFELLSPETTARIEKDLALDLTEEGKLDLLERFEQA